LSMAPVPTLEDQVLVALLLRPYERADPFSLARWAILTRSSVDDVVLTLYTLSRNSALALEFDEHDQLSNVYFAFGRNRAILREPAVTRYWLSLPPLVVEPACEHAA
jgi:hypothetical protein